MCVDHGHLRRPVIGLIDLLPPMTLVDTSAEQTRSLARSGSWERLRPSISPVRRRSTWRSVPPLPALHVADIGSSAGTTPQASDGADTWDGPIDSPGAMPRTSGDRRRPSFGPTLPAATSPAHPLSRPSLSSTSRSGQRSWHPGRWCCSVRPVDIYRCSSGRIGGWMRSCVMTLGPSRQPWGRET